MHSPGVRWVGISVEVLSEHFVECLQGKPFEVDGEFLISVRPRFFGDVQEMLPEMGNDRRGRDTGEGGIPTHGYVHS